ncbi:hypothetical protein Leryth_023784 [Lithospermum erythrorhizon]|nr:hypothetical protein Leryth_023784 [Lithospermum erythrorhizon]
MEEESEHLKRVFIDAASGAISGAVSRTITSPLDVIKIRFQVQLEPTIHWSLLRREAYAKSKYTGMLQATKDIFREEGLRGFWRGNVPALLMVMPYTAIQFTVLNKLKTFVSGSSKSGLIFILSKKNEILDSVTWVAYLLSFITSGAVAGCAATVGSYPFDLVRTILASQGEPKVYPNMRSAFAEILRTRGFPGLYAGLTPTLVEIIPYAGLQFGTYDTFKRWVMEWNHRSSYPNEDDDTLSSFQLFFCGLAAGSCAKAVCHPLDVVKKRFQIEGLQRDPRYGARVERDAYKGMYDALRRIMYNEGWNGLYKGIVPSIIKAAPAGAVTFVAYEFTSDWFETILT